MKTCLTLFLSLLFFTSTFSQISFLQYRNVPAEHEEEFVEKETKYWAKVAKAAIDKGDMVAWALWRKVGVTEEGAPNYIFVNAFKSVDDINMGAVWSEANLDAMGVSPDMVETNSISTVTFDYWVQREDMIPGDIKYAIVNYAMPTNRNAFIKENKELWKPFWEKSMADGTTRMKAWGVASVIHPTGKSARFSCYTYDGFESMADALDYLRYQEPGEDGAWADQISKSKMGELMPDGFEYSIIYELVKRVVAEE